MTRLERIKELCECGDCDNLDEPSCTAGNLSVVGGKSLYTIDCGDHHALPHATSKFIAQSREDIPYLLSLIEEAEKALEFYITWERESEDAWSKTYNRTQINMNYPGPSIAREALARMRGMG